MGGGLPVGVLRTREAGTWGAWAWPHTVLPLVGGGPWASVHLPCTSNSPNRGTHREPLQEGRRRWGLLLAAAVAWGLARGPPALPSPSSKQASGSNEGQELIQPSGHGLWGPQGQEQGRPGSHLCTWGGEHARAGTRVAFGLHTPRTPPRACSSTPRPRTGRRGAGLSPWASTALPEATGEKEPPDQATTRQLDRHGWV